MLCFPASLISITLRKRKPRNQEHWCFMHAKQSNCCRALDFLSLELCPQKPQAKHNDDKIQGLMQQREYEL